MKWKNVVEGGQLLLGKVAYNLSCSGNDLFLHAEQV